MVVLASFRPENRYHEKTSFELHSKEFLMQPEIGLTNAPFNTKFAPLAALGWKLLQDGTLHTFEKVTWEAEKSEFSLATKLIQVLGSILADCEYLCEVNSQLRSETELARAWGFERYLEQSSLASFLNRLTRMNLDELEQVSQTIWHSHSRSCNHDWRGFLYVELDLSGLPCGKNAEESQKGYFSGKKTLLDAS
jgi:hypothetical protein